MFRAVMDRSVLRQLRLPGVLLTMHRLRLYADEPTSVDVGAWFFGWRGFIVGYEYRGGDDYHKIRVGLWRVSVKVAW